MNEKIGRNNLERTFKVFRMNRKELSNLEKIILKRIKPSDFYVVFAKEESSRSIIKSSVRYMKETGRVFSHLTLKCKSPHIEIKFKPRSTKFMVHRKYSKGAELSALNEVFQEVCTYLEEKEIRGLQGAVSSTKLII